MLVMRPDSGHTSSSQRRYFPFWDSNPAACSRPPLVWSKLGAHGLTTRGLSVRLRARLGLASNQSNNRDKKTQIESLFVADGGSTLSSFSEPVLGIIHCFRFRFDDSTEATASWVFVNLLLPCQFLESLPSLPMNWWVSRVSKWRR